MRESKNHLKGFYYLAVVHLEAYMPIITLVCIVKNNEMAKRLQQKYIKQERTALKLAHGELQYAIKRSLYINKWLSYSKFSCFTAAILTAILEFVIRFVSISWRLCPMLFRAI